MSEIVDLAAARRARALPAPRATALPAEPPAGKRRGDKVWLTGHAAPAVVMDARIERLFGGAPRFMLTVWCRGMSIVVLADEVDPYPPPSPGSDAAGRILPADVEA